MVNQENDEARGVSRKKLLRRVKRVVVKVGSAVLAGRDGLSRKVLYDLSDDIFGLWQRGMEVVLVSSGAIASGMKKIGLPRRPDSISQKQAVAAVGQCSLMLAWEKAFGRHGQKVAQILITRDDFNHRGRYLNARNTIFTLLSWRIIPIINENDTVVMEEIKFGDNDSLSAMVTDLLDAHFLVILTDEEGLYDKDPRTDENAKLIKVVGRVSRETLKYAGSKPGSLGTGGMESKIRAGQKASLGGVPVVIANGSKPGILKEIFKGKEEGTLVSSSGREPVQPEALDCLYQGPERGDCRGSRSGESAAGRRQEPASLGHPGGERSFRPRRLGGRCQRGERGTGRGNGQL